MPSQIIERSFELAMHAASVESYEAFETVLSRLRTLDRHNEIPIERYLAIEGIAHARAGHVAQARELSGREPDLAAVRKFDPDHLRIAPSPDGANVRRS